MENNIVQNKKQEEKKDNAVKENPNNNVVQNKEINEDRHSVDYPYSNEKDWYDIPDEHKFDDDVRLGSGTYSQLEDFDKALDNIPARDLTAKYSNKEKTAMSVAYQTKPTVVQNKVLEKHMNSNMEDWVNDLEYGDSKLNTKQAAFANQNGKVTGQRAVARFNAILSVGAIIHVPLWHSGFWITLKPPTQREIINLELNIASNSIKLGRETNTMVYSNYSVIFNKIVTEFIKDHIIDHTLKLEEGDDITKHILINDFYILVNGILSGMNPKGLNISRTCNNVIKMDEEDNKINCDYIVNSLCDPNKLVWVNRKVLSNKMLNQMSKKQPNSVTVQDAVEYQKSLANITEKEYVIKTDNDVEFTLYIKPPTLSKYIDAGEEWVERIIQDTESLFTESDTNEVKDDKINKMLTASLLSIYSSFVTKIAHKEQNIEVTDDITICQLLDNIALDDGAYKSTLEAIQDYITDSSIAIVATPAFICPKCKTNIKNDNLPEGHPFEALIPINVLEVFFAQCARRNRRLRAKVMS